MFCGFRHLNGGDFAPQNQPQFRKKGSFRNAKAMVIRMKMRESFEQIRMERNKLSLRFRLVLLVSSEIVAALLIALAFSDLLGNILDIDSTLLMGLEILICSLIIGFGATSLLSKLFFSPISKLREAIGKVADGDFSVRLNTKSSSKEIRELYMGFNLMVHELQSTEILQTDFVSNVSHEFKTPINAIEGYSTLLQDCDNLSADQQEYLEKILFNTSRLTTLVGNILLLSKIENQDIQSNQNKFRLDEQIRQAILSLERTWTEKNINFDVDMDSISYVSNENLFNHVWTNLIGNAIKFTPEDSTIRMRLENKKSSFVFTIEDQGPGMSEEVKKHIFDKFYQADTSHKQEGNGLGLALVKRILSIDGSEIEAENIDPINGGCRFTVTMYPKHE